MVEYAAQTHHKAIPIKGSASDRGISSGTGSPECVGFGIPAAHADTSGASLTLDTSLEYQRTNLEDLGATDRCDRCDVTLDDQL